MPRLIVSPRARADLFDIAGYISENNPSAADRLLTRFSERFEQLAERPLLGRPRFDIRPDIRSVPIDRYVIFYRPVRDGIEVVRVLHSARDVTRLFGA